MNEPDEPRCQIAAPFIEALVFFEPEWCEALVPGPPGPISLDDDSWFIVLEG